MQNDTTTYDLVIIGAGPTGLAAAIYASREGMNTLVVEKAVIGGMAAITDMIDNYPGFEDGVSGLDLADHLFKQAKRFGATVKTGVEVTGLSRMDGVITLATKANPIRALAVLVATGSTYRQLDVPGEKELVGRGVHFCATCDGPFYRGRELVVVGGGNSALQETLFLARFASKITMLVRGARLGGTEFLRHQVEALPNVEYRFNTTVSSFAPKTEGIGLENVTVYNSATATTEALQPAAVFTFIGLIANTEAFTSSLSADDRNFLTTGMEYESNVPGVFVAGDVRSGSTWQIASAVGEGVSATLAIRKYLDGLKHVPAEITATV